MAEDFSVLSEQASSVINDQYYKQLQSQLKEKRDIEQHDQKNDHQGDEFEESVANSSSKIKRVDRRDRIQKIQDKVHIQSLSWEMDDKGDYQLSSDQRPQVLTSVDLENNGQKILRSLGHKIDYNSKMGQMKQQFMQNIIQSRSSNFFLSIYASFKVGLMGQLMSLMGMDPNELESMKREAIEEARKENIQLMEENIYTIELTESIKGKGKSNRRSIEMLYENQSQLVIQMDKLGNQGFWSKIRLLEEQVKQDNVLIEEFQNEKNALEYQLSYLGHDAQARGINAPSTEVRVGGDDDSNYSPTKLKSKIEVLGKYISRIQLRKKRYTEKLMAELDQNKDEKRLIEIGKKVLKIEDQGASA